MLSAADLTSSGEAPPSIVGVGMFMQSCVVVVAGYVFCLGASVVDIWIEDEIDGGVNAWIGVVVERASMAIADIILLAVEVAMVDCNDQYVE